KLPSNLNDTDRNAGFLELVEGQSINNDNDLIEVEEDFGSEIKSPSKKNNQHVAEEGKRIIKKTDAVPDQHFKEMKQESLLSKAWPRAIRRLFEYDQKEFITIREEIESRVVTLWLANNRGWKLALQVVGGNNKMMQKYKDQIGISQIKRKYREEFTSTSSESKSEERKSVSYNKNKKRRNGYYSFCNKRPHESNGLLKSIKDPDSNKMIDNTQRIVQTKLSLKEVDVKQLVVGRIHQISS
ncbi:15826_t:CDS:2, partial [Racocetra persica]